MYKFFEVKDGVLMNLIKYFVGFICSKVDSSYKYYKQIKNTSMVANEGSIILGNVSLGCPQNIKIGNNSYVNGGVISASANATITIGDNCMISYGVHIRTDMHSFDRIDVPMNKQGMIEKSIVIGNDVWIGYGAQILAGVKIADGCIIGAGAVVTHDTKPYCVYGGVPAKIIRKRTNA